MRGRFEIPFNLARPALDVGDAPILLGGAMPVCGVALTQTVKTWFIRRFGDRKEQGT